MSAGVDDFYDVQTEGAVIATNNNLKKKKKKSAMIENFRKN